MLKGIGAVDANTTKVWSPFRSDAELVSYCGREGLVGWLQYANDSGCWSYERNAWQQMAALPAVPNLTVAPGAIPSAYGPGPASVEAAESEVNQVLSDSWQNQRERIAIWGSGLPDDPIPAVPCTILNVPCSTVWMTGAAIALGLAVFGKVIL